MFDFNYLKSQSFSFVLKIISKINFKLLITLICLLFLAYSIHGNFNDLAKQEITLKVFIWLSGGIVFSFLSIIINAYAWKSLINSIGCNSNKLNIIKIFLNTNIYKYLPGGIWHFVSRYRLLRLEFSTAKAVESILLEPLLMLVSGMIFIPFGYNNIYILIICWSSTLVFITGFREFIIKKFKVMKATTFDKIDKLDSENIVQDNDTIPTRKTVYPYKPLFVEIVFILFRFFGFLCCLNAFSIGSLISQGELISYFSLAWIIGLIVPAAPGGLGVFESVIFVGLGTQLPEAPLLASLLLYRITSTFSDVFVALIYPVKRLIRV
tara:strand:+ start:347 stop:1315 length:969 start_codon:yes stop_codon:yes gene_type:complete